MLPNDRQESKPGPRPTASPSYDPENEGAWNGQLPNPDLVDQLPPPTERKPGGPLDRFTWLKPATRELTGAGFKFVFALAGYSNDQGRCYPSHARLRLDTGLSDSGLRKGQREAVNTGWVVVEVSGKGKASSHYRLTGADTGWVRVSPEEHPGCHQSNTPGCHQSNDRTLSSSNPKINPKDPGAVDAKRVDHVDHPGPETGVTTGVKFSFLEEEGVTGTGPKDYQAFQDFVDGQLSDIPTDSEIEPLGKHCWPAWAKHWGGGWAAAWPTWTKDTAGRKKFRKDVVAQLAKVGLPKPMEPNVEDQAARERSSSWMDQRMAEAPKRMVDVKCAGCGLPRQLKPGETHCYQCRNLSEDPQLASQPDRGPGFADDYEKLIEETIRRYQEAHGLAPGDPKVEAVGAALDAG